MRDPLVLLPGMMCDARVFAPQIAAFSADRAVHVAPVTLGESLEDIAAGVLETAPEEFALAGLGMGGMVAMEIMRQAPARVLRLALMDTNCLSETPEVAAEREPRIAAARAGRLDDVMRQEIKADYLAPGPARLAVLNTVMEMARALGPQVFVRQSRALQKRGDLQRTLRTVRVPTVVLCGRHDTLYPVRRHEFMAGLVPDADFHVIEAAGHLPTLEAPEDTTAALRRWLTDTLFLREPVNA